MPVSCATQLYEASLLRAVKKTAGEGLFPLFFVDSPHPSRRHLEDVWGAAKRAGFEAYVVDLFDVGLQVRSILHRPRPTLSLTSPHLPVAGCRLSEELQLVYDE